MSDVQSLGLTFLVNSLWQAPLAAIAAAGICRVLQKAPARHRHAVCVTALVLAVALPLASMRRWSAPAQTVEVGAPVFAEPGAGWTGAVPAARPAVARAAWTVTLPDVASWAALGMFGLFLSVRLAGLARAALKTARICQGSSERRGADEAWERCAPAFGVRGAELRWSEAVSGPVTAGRMVILPVSMAHAPEAVLETALAHELAHIARGDFWLNVLCELISLPVSYHPAAVWLRREIERTREVACDELVTARLMPARAYAESMMTIAATMAGLARPGYTLGVFDGDILEERIRRLLRPAAVLKRARLWLAAGLAAMGACLILASGLAISARAQTPAQEEVKAGVEAYNRGDFPEAVERFERAVKEDPGNVNARLHLANAVLQRAKGDMKNVPAAIEQAKQQYQEVLERDPSNQAAISALAAFGGPGEARKWHDILLKLIENHASQANLYYAAGALDWQMVYRSILERQRAAGLSPEQYFIPDAAVRAWTREHWLPTIEEGYRLLQIALDRDPHLDAAMAYMNLLLRANAAIAETEQESATLVRRADEWVGKAIAEMKAKKQGPAPLDPNAPPPTPTVAIPAPPPPPPGTPRGEKRK
jgi:beta-lactamase regulating signal transducer with metallopeptidase domain